MTVFHLVPCANHLWQSTLFALVGGSLTLTLRQNRAAIRYWLWFAASAKFLLPFSLLADLAAQWQWRSTVPLVQRQVSVVFQQIGQPFVVTSTGTAEGSAPGGHLLPEIFLVIWVLGALYSLIAWLLTLRRLSAIRRRAVPTPLNLPIPVMSTDAPLEPGVFGIWRPVLILPSGLAERLTTAQWNSVLAHELCHVRRRDNLTAAIHLAVETVFWFHPLVRWIGSRLMAERERACDEAVLQAGNEPGAYAQGILSVCGMLLEAAPACASGIAGADLKRRIESIMTHGSIRRLGIGKKIALSTAALAAIAIPLLAGLIHPAPGRAQSQLPRLSFDVASVKPSSQAWLQIAPEHSGGRIHWTTDLWYLTSYAYSMPRWRISGPLPGSDHLYSIDANTAPTSSEKEIREMFQSLLADRFRMVAHTVSKETNGYILSVAKGGFKFPLAQPEGKAPPLPPWIRAQNPAELDGKVVATAPAPGVSAITGRRAPLSKLCQALELVLQTFVLDETGLKGDYYFALRYARENHPDDTDLPDLAGALQSELGLKLERKKGPIDMLVVDHIESTPTQN